MKHGFTLFEVMITLAIIGAAVPVILTLAGALFRTTTHAEQLIDRVVDMKNMLADVHQNPQAAHTQQRGFPVSTMKYTEKPVSEKSALKGTKNLVIERISAQWHTDKKQQEDTLIAIRYKPETKKQE